MTTDAKTAAIQTLVGAVSGATGELESSATLARKKVLESMKTGTINWLEWCVPEEFNLIPAATKNRLRVIIEGIELALRVLKLPGCTEVNRNADGAIFAVGSRFPDGKIEVPTVIPTHLKKTPFDFLGDDEPFPPSKIEMAKLTERWFQYWLETATYLTPETNRQDRNTAICVTDELLTLTINNCATEYGTYANEDRPILECEIPVLGHRFSASIPPLEPSPSFSLRRKADRVYTLAEYVAQGVITASQHESIKERILQNKNFLIVGATGSGKSTFMNAILHEISLLDPKTRVICIEEINELQCTVKDKVMLLVPAPNAKGKESQTTIESLLKHIKRRTPRRIVIGEVRAGEVFHLLDAWNSGHPGGLVSAHADSAESGLSKIESCLELGGWNVSKSAIGRSINCVISIQPTTLMDPETGVQYGARIVDKMLDVERYIPETDSYITTPF